MKRLFSLLVAVVMCNMMMAQAVIKFEKNEHDFGDFVEKSLQKYDFVFVNSGDQTLVIKQTYGSCGCIKVQAAKKNIEPGEKGVVSVVYDGKGKFPGKFKKPITVRSNASNQIVRLYIAGNMLPSKEAL